MFYFYPQSILSEISEARVINIAGKRGRGKTLLGVAIAIKFWQMGLIDHIITSFPLGGRTINLEGIEKRFVVVADELGLIMDSRTYSKNNPEDFLLDIRKKDAFFISSSAKPVDVRFRDLLIERIRPNYGNKAWRYQFQTTEGSNVYTGDFWLINPSYIFGMYPTKFRVHPDYFLPIREFMKKDAPELDPYLAEEQGFNWIHNGNLQYIDGGFYGEKTVKQIKTPIQSIYSIIKRKKKE